MKYRFTLLTLIKVNSQFFIFFDIKMIKNIRVFIAPINYSKTSQCSIYGKISCLAREIHIMMLLHIILVKGKGLKLIYIIKY
jgi:hypothetical protein